jgi:hypothetical protein
MNFNINVTLYFGAVRKCSIQIFYLKKFLLACGTKGSLAVLGCETCVDRLGDEDVEETFEGNSNQLPPFSPVSILINSPF